MKVLVAQPCLTLATPWTVACQAPLSKGFSKQKYWSGLPCPSPGDLPHPEMETVYLYISCIGRGFFITSATWEAQQYVWFDPLTLGKNINYEFSMISSPLGE